MSGSLHGNGNERGVADKTAFGAAIVGTYVSVYLMQKIRFKDIIMASLVGIMFGNIISGVTDCLSYKYDMVQKKMMIFCCFSYLYCVKIGKYCK